MKAQGTELFVIDPEGNSGDGEVLDVGCVLEINGIDATIDQNETTCLRDLVRTYEAGLATPGQASFTMQFSPLNPVHVRMREMKKAGLSLQWALGWSDDGTGTGIQPTGVDTDGTFIVPATRSWSLFEGFMNSFPLNFAQNSQVTAPVTVQVSGDDVLIPKTA